VHLLLDLFDIQQLRDLSFGVKRLSVIDLLRLGVLLFMVHLDFFFMIIWDIIILVISLL
jgi:hypothetical protein